jgi:outer membrane biosynthesis protein TonB
MSQETRAVALAHAITFHAGKAGLAGVLEAATTFNNFLNADSGVVLPNPVVAAEAEKPKAEKPAKVKAEKAKPAPEPEPEVADEPEGPTKEDVGKSVEAMLAANKRKEAIALMKKFGATSVSSLDAKNYAAFLEESEAILMAA